MPAAQVLAQSLPSNLREAREERNRSTVSVISGGISGTYIRFATDLANVLDDTENNELRVLPIVGRGGGQNVLDVLFLKGVDMGITQQDHLTFFKQQDPRLYGVEFESRHGGADLQALRGMQVNKRQNQVAGICQRRAG